MSNFEKITIADRKSWDLIFEHKETNKQYSAAVTNTGKLKLYSLTDDTGASDIIITIEDFNSNYELKE